MKKFSTDQKVYSIGGVTIGGQPGEWPTVLMGSIFFSRHQIVSDPATGVFDAEKAIQLLQREEAASCATCIPRIIDPIGETGEALISYIRFIADHTEAPILVDSPSQKARLQALRHFAGSSVISRLIYNSIGEDFTEEELACIKECGVRSAVILAFSTKAIKPADRLRLLTDKLLPAAERGGIEQMLIDPGVLDIPSISWTALAIEMIKEQLGYPAGCAPSNALLQWERIRSQGAAAFQAAAASVFATLQLMGADFLFYGPVRFAPWAYSACAATDALLAYGGRLRGTRPAGREHPLYKIF